MSQRTTSRYKSSRSPLSKGKLSTPSKSVTMTCRPTNNKRRSCLLKSKLPPTKKTLTATSNLKIPTLTTKLASKKVLKNQKISNLKTQRLFSLHLKKSRWQSRTLRSQKRRLWRSRNRKSSKVCKRIGDLMRIKIKR